MIYIIIGQDTVTGNEWVMKETYDDSLKAAEACEYLNTHNNIRGNLMDLARYRVDTVEPTEGKSTARLYADKQVDIRETKLRLNAEYRRSKMDHEEQHYVYQDTDSMRTKEFTMGDLFNHGGAVDECFECGAKVSNYSTHVTWHNKLLP